jgi:hypothetical protein
VATNNSINISANNGGIVYSSATNFAVLAGTATANQVLLSGSTSAPSWSTATYPATTTVNQLLYSSSANTIAGISTANNGVLITSAGGVPSISSTLPTAVQDNITRLGTIASIGAPLGGTFGGTGINNGSSTITIGGSVTFSGAFTFTGTITGNTSVTFPTSGTLATTGQVITPIDQTSGSVTMTSNRLYVTDNGASLVTYTLPTSSSVGDVVEIIGKSSGLWKIAQAAGQQISVGSSASTLGAAGFIAATLASDCVKLVCTTANTIWTNASAQGNLTVS